MFQLSSAKKKRFNSLSFGIVFFHIVLFDIPCRNWYVHTHMRRACSILFDSYRLWLISHIVLFPSFVVCHSFLSSVVCHPFFVTCCLSFFFCRRFKCISYPQTKIDFNNLNFGPVFIHNVLFFAVCCLSIVDCRLLFVVWCLMYNVWCLSSIFCCLGSNCMGIQRLTIVAS